MGGITCSCNKLKQSDENIHVDLAIARFDTKLDFDKNKSMWCFKPQPLIAMEFKALFNLTKGSGLEEDVESLKIMHTNFGAKLLYLCFVYDANPKMKKSDEKEFKRLISKIRKDSKKEKSFRIATGSYEPNSWRIINPYSPNPTL